MEGCDVVNLLVPERKAFLGDFSGLSELPNFQVPTDILGENMGIALYIFGPYLGRVPFLSSFRHLWFF